MLLPEAEFTSFLRKRVGRLTSVYDSTDPSAAVDSFFDTYDVFCNRNEKSTAARLSHEAIDSDSPVGMRLDDARTLVISGLCHVDSTSVLVLSVQEGPIPLACSMVQNAIESWTFQCEIVACQAALKESAAQLAQSFEEQNWLRGFARNATSISNVTNANDVASGILQPLGYLLRAEDIFLLVDPEETERSGLTSTKYGGSNFTVDSIRNVLESFQMTFSSPPVVRNHSAIDTPCGPIDSLVAVPIVGADQNLGYLVGINRSNETHGSLSWRMAETEFGSGDVRLLEEAAVLLSTQARNLHLVIESNQLFLGTLHAMSSAIDARDQYTQGHSERVARLSFDLAEILGLSDEACREIYLAGILHDIGKIGIPDRVLLKNGPLTDEEFEIIQRHPEIGHRIVERLGHLHFVLPGILYHHERWDGKGYPHGLSGESIPLMARIMAVADAFDAMTSSRPYRNAMPVEKASSIVFGGGGQQWDAQIVECFKLWLAERTATENPPLMPAASIIPQDSPVEYIFQAVTTLRH